LLPSALKRTIISTILFALVGAEIGILLLIYLIDILLETESVILPKTVFEEMTALRETFNFWFLDTDIHGYIIIASFLVFPLLIGLMNRDIFRAIKQRPVISLFIILMTPVSMCLALYFHIEQDASRGLFLLLFFSFMLLYMLIHAEEGVLSKLAGEKYMSSRKAALLSIATVVCSCVVGTVFTWTVANIVTQISDYAIPDMEIKNSGFYIIIGTLFFSMSFALFAATIMNLALRAKSKNERWRMAATAVIPLLIILITAYAFYLNNLKLYGNGDKTLNDAAGLTFLAAPPKPRTVLWLKPQSETMGMPAPLRIESRSKDPFFHKYKTFNIDYLPENLEKLNRYIASKQEDPAVFYADARRIRAQIARIHWFIEDYRKLSAANGRENSDFLYLLNLAFSLRYAPVTADNISLLEYLSNEEHFIIGSRRSRSVADTWLAYGNIEKAKHFYQKAGLKKEKDYDKIITALESGKKTFITGVVKGRINGKISKGTRIGLQSTNIFYFGKEHFFTLAMTGAQELSNDGRFSFSNLQEGKYILLLLLPSGEEGPFKIEGGGEFEVNAKNPVVVKNINVVKSDKGGKN